MTPELIGEGVSKGLEIWILQNLLDLGIILVFFLIGIFSLRGYLDRFRERLILRLSVEIWDLFLDLLTDFLMVIIFLIGLFITNPDIMVDIKIALPWIPLSFLLVGVSFVIKLRKNVEIGSVSWKVVLTLLLLSAIFSWFGFTFVMEGATREYYESGVYPYLWKIFYNMRSDVNRELSLITFYLLSPLYFLTFLWMVFSGLRITTFRKINDKDGK